MNIKLNDKFHFVKNIIYVFFAIYIITLFIDNTSIVFGNEYLTKAIKFIRYICYMVFCVKILYDLKNDFKITYTMLIYLSLSAAILLVSKNPDILILLIVLLATKKLDFNKLIKITFYIFTCSFFLIIILSLLKIIPDWTYSRGNIIRHSLGFYYTTITSGIYLSIVLMYFFIRKYDFNYIELLILQTINTFLYYLTDGRLSFILITFILIIMLVGKILKSNKIISKINNIKALHLLVATLPFLLFLSTLLLTYLYGLDNGAATKVNSLLSGRIKLNYNAFSTYGVPLFGENVEWQGWGGFGYVNIDETKEFVYNYVDTSYVRIIFDYGIIFTACVLLAYSFMIYKCFKEKKYFLLQILIFVLIWSSVEPYIIYVGKNIFILTFSRILDIGKIDLLNFKNIGKKIRLNENGEK